MIMIERATPPTEEPVTLVQAKAHLRVDIDDDDALIAGLIMAAREWAEGYAWRTFVTTGWLYQLDGWPAEQVITLPRPNLRTVTAVTYVDKNGDELTLDAADYALDVVSKPGRLFLLDGVSWPTVTLRPLAGVQIEYTAGYGAANEVPQLIKQAILLIVGDLYENRENTIIASGISVVEAPLAAKRLLDMVRVKEW